MVACVVVLKMVAKLNEKLIKLGRLWIKDEIFSELNGMMLFNGKSSNHSIKYLLMPFSKAALVSGPGPSIGHAESSGPQLLEYMSILSSLCTKAADSVASVASFSSSRKRMSNRIEYGRSIIQIQIKENVLPSYLHPYLNPCYLNPFKVNYS